MSHHVDCDTRRFSTTMRQRCNCAEIDARDENASLRSRVTELEGEVERLRGIVTTDISMPMLEAWKERDEARAEVESLTAACQLHNAAGVRLEAENATLRAALEESMRVLQVAAERAIDMGNAVVALGGADINRGQFLSLVEETWRTQRAALTAKEGE
jgi:hypothetical protein